jgi:hypothetical protein
MAQTPMAIFFAVSGSGSWYQKARPTSAAVARMTSQSSSRPSSRRIVASA